MKGKDFDRTVSKEEYIKWLENAVSAIQKIDERRRIDYGNERVSQLIQSPRDINVKPFDDSVVGGQIVSSSQLMRRME